MMILLSTTISLMFMLNTPISSILILIMLTMIISFMTLNIMNSSWLPSIVFLMMVGGMLILFIYMASISPNKKLLYTSKSSMTNLVLLCIMMNLMFPQSNSFNSINSPILIYSMIFNTPFMIFSISYLFLFLFILTLLFKKKSAPMRSM